MQHIANAPVTNSFTDKIVEYIGETKLSICNCFRFFFTWLEGKFFSNATDRLVKILGGGPEKEVENRKLLKNLSFTNRCKILVCFDDVKVDSLVKLEEIENELLGQGNPSLSELIKTFKLILAEKGSAADVTHSIMHATKSEIYPEVSKLVADILGKIVDDVARSTESVVVKDVQKDAAMNRVTASEDSESPTEVVHGSVVVGDTLHTVAEAPKDITEHRDTTLKPIPEVDEAPNAVTMNNAPTPEDNAKAIAVQVSYAVDNDSLPAVRAAAIELLISNAVNDIIPKAEKELVVQALISVAKAIDNMKPDAARVAIGSLVKAAVNARMPMEITDAVIKAIQSVASLYVALPPERQVAINAILAIFVDPHTPDEIKKAAIQALKDIDGSAYLDDETRHMLEGSKGIWN